MPRPALLAAVLAMLAPASAVAAEPAAAPAGGDSPAAVAAPTPRAELAAALLAETNRVRRLHGRRPLKAHAAIELAAAAQAAFMALALTAQHLSPIRGQRTPAERVQRHGVDPEGTGLAENVASFPVGRDAAPPPAAEIAAILVGQWLASPGHRVPLLSRDFTHFGGAIRVARVPGDAWCAFGVQLFFRPRDPFGRAP